MKDEIRGRTIGFLLCAVMCVATMRAAVAEEQKKEELPEIKKVELGKIANLSSAGEKVFFAGQPSEADFKLLAEKGVKKVINLRTEEEMKTLGFDEKAAAEAAGLTYVQVGVGREPLTDEQIEKILKELESVEKEPMLLHCASSNRVGAVWSMYRGTRGGLAIEQAIEEGKKAGMRAPNLEQRAREYLQKNAKK
jgi:uncharacterized protein (TIGR01244 family)